MKKFLIGGGGALLIALVGLMATQGWLPPTQNALAEVSMASADKRTEATRYLVVLNAELARYKNDLSDAVFRLGQNPSDQSAISDKIDAENAIADTRAEMTIVRAEANKN